jgi:hypothetical protein
MACFKVSIITCIICTIGFGLALGLYIMPTFLGVKEFPCTVTDCHLGRCSRQVFVAKGVYRTEYYDCLKLTVELQINPPERWVFDRFGTCPANGTIRTCYYTENQKKETISLDSPEVPSGAIATIVICGFVWNSFLNLDDLFML